MTRRRPPTPRYGTGTRGIGGRVEQFMAAWEDASVEPKEIVDAGDRVLVRVNYRVRGKGQGIEVELDVFHVVTIRDRQAILIEIYGDEGRARRAAGLSA